MTDQPLTERVRADLIKRRDELQPLVSEYEEIQRLLAVIGGENSSTPARRRRAPRTSALAHGRRRRGGQRGSGNRSAQTLALVERKPGITIPELGKEMGITPNYLYRVLPQLAKDGKVKKD